MRGRFRVYSPEEYLARRRAKYRANHERELRRAKARRDKNPEAVKCAQKKYRASERCREKRRELYAKNPEKFIATSMLWRSKNKEILAAYMSQWASQNREHINKRRKERRLTDPSIREREKAAAHRDIEKRRETARNWYRKNPQKKLAHNRNRAAKLRGAGSHTEQDVVDRLVWQRGKCGYCRRRLSVNFHVDHINPIIRGGSNKPRNIQILCKTCNLQKNAQVPEEFARKRGLLL